jgi:hypothetical protein
VRDKCFHALFTRFGLEFGGVNETDGITQTPMKKNRREAAVFFFAIGFLIQTKLQQKNGRE